QAGCGPMTPRIQRLVKAYQPVVHPESGQPLGAAEWMAVYLGYLRLPIEVPKELSLANAQRLEPLLLDWLEQEQARQGLGFREVSRRLREAWSGEEGECKRLVRVLAGLEEYGPKHLSELWEVIGTALVAALGVEGDAWGLAERLLGEVQGAEGVALGKGGGGVASAKSGGGSGKGAVAVATTGAAVKGKAAPTGNSATSTGKSAAVGKAGAAVSAGGKASPNRRVGGIAKAPLPTPAAETKPRATTRTTSATKRTSTTKGSTSASRATAAKRSSPSPSPTTAKTSAVAKATTKATTKTSIKAKPPSKGSSPATAPGKGKASPTPRPARRRRTTGLG
ncbi:MAG: hypothetical protein ACK587_15840, partial [Cyanobacteriota bacterium]